LVASRRIFRPPSTSLSLAARQCFAIWLTRKPAMLDPQRRAPYIACHDDAFRTAKYPPPPRRNGTGAGSGLIVSPVPPDFGRGTLFAKTAVGLDPIVLYDVG